MKRGYGLTSGMASVILRESEEERTIMKLLPAVSKNLVIQNY